MARPQFHRLALALVASTTTALLVASCSGSDGSALGDSSTPTPTPTPTPTAEKDASAAPDSSVAPAPSCTDTQKNGSETDVDCGGACATKCATGKACADDPDCAGNVRCTGLVCQPPTNVDALRNGSETDVDCGGGAPTNAPRCTTGQLCGVASDCASNACEGGTCAPCQALQIPVGGGAVVTGSAAVLLSTGNYCYEAWAWVDGSKSSPAYLAACSTGDNCNAILSIRNDLGQVLFAVQKPGQPLLKAAFAIGGGLDPDDSAWHHVAGCRSIAGAAVTATLFWDGQLVASASGTTASIGSPTDLRLGSLGFATTDGLGGYLDEVRVSNTLRYTANFVPKTRFTRDASTAVLLHFDSFAGSTFVDSSSNAFSGSMLGTTASAPVCK